MWQLIMKNLRFHLGHYRLQLYQLHHNNEKDLAFLHQAQYVAVFHKQLCDQIV